MNFIDKNPWSTTGYAVTNEEPELIASMLKGLRFNRVGCICSGGELIYSIFLPKTTGRIFAVDHSYRAIIAAHVKGKMLKELGLKGLLESFNDKYNGKKLKQFAVDLPESLKVISDKPSYYGSLDTNWDNGLSQYDWPNLRREWGCGSRGRERGIESSAQKKLDKITFIHGDLSDLAEHATPKKFDFLYFSNAFEHVGRDNKRPALDNFKDIIKEGGLVLATSDRNSTHGQTKPEYLSPAFEEVQKIHGFRTSWNYHLLKRLPSSAMATSGVPL